MQDPSLYSQIKAQVQNQFPEQEHLKCPRCDSTNTKFCYYNNYNLSQPRHFCKSCRRYWTKGGALRNIPVGGGSRKNTKRSSSAPATSSAAKRPAAAESAPAASNKDHGNSNNGGSEMSGSLLPFKGDNFGGHFGDLMEVSGSFRLLLGSNGGQFGSFTDGLGLNGSSSQHFGDPGSGHTVVDPQVMGSGSSSNAGGFMSIQGGGGGGGEGGCWSGGNTGWPDLAMYTPGPTFQ